jgi:ribosomal protein S18 acetylase RimI-like enzyme
MKANCRVLESKDSQKYRAVRLESLRLHPECFGSKYEIQCKLPKLYFEDLIESGNQESVMIGAFVGKDLIGLCGLTPVAGSALEVIQMYVAAGCRGHGIGEQMLLEAQVILKSRPEKQLLLTVYESNPAAVKVYEKAGFEHVSADGYKLFMGFKP